MENMLCPAWADTKVDYSIIGNKITNNGVKCMPTNSQG